MPHTPDELLRFPTGLDASEIKKRVKKIKKSSGLLHNQALRGFAKESGIDFP